MWNSWKQKRHKKREVEKRKKQKQGNKTKKKKMEEEINVEGGERESKEFSLVTIEQLRPAAATQQGD